MLLKHREPVHFHLSNLNGLCRTYWNLTSIFPDSKIWNTKFSFEHKIVNIVVGETIQLVFSMLGNIEYSNKPNLAVPFYSYIFLQILWINNGQLVTIHEVIQVNLLNIQWSISHHTWSYTGKLIEYTMIN